MRTFLRDPIRQRATSSIPLTRLTVVPYPPHKNLRSMSLFFSLFLPLPPPVCPDWCSEGCLKVCTGAGGYPHLKKGSSFLMKNFPFRPIWYKNSFFEPIWWKKCRSVFQARFKSLLGVSHAFFWDQICGLSAKRKNKDKQDLYIFRHSALSLLLRCHCCSSRVSSSRQASAKAGSHRSIPFLPTWKKKAVQIWMQGRDGKDRAELEHWNSLWNGQVIGDFISQLPNGHALPHDTMHYM